MQNPRRLRAGPRYQTMTDLCLSAPPTVTGDTNTAHRAARPADALETDALPPTMGSPAAPSHDPHDRTLGTHSSAPDKSGFRHALRRATRREHDAVERAFAPFHQSPLPHLAWFLTCQHTALHALAGSRCNGTGHSVGLLAALTAALREDCAVNGDHPATVSVDALPRLHPLAVDYLVLGSRMGNEVLRRRLAGAADQLPLPAYFAPRDHLVAWRATCTDLDQIPPTGALARRVVADTRQGFGLFDTAARLNSLRPSAP
ncbi:hypothetical protein OL67_002761 [Phaeobacter piscinae]|nr:hypothetical protein OL67_002761 [Phaeobacter piscinae]